MQRITVVGSAGAGKSTLAAHLAATMGVPHIELDAIFHQPNWTPLPTADFQRVVGDRVPEQGSWVVDGNYSKVQSIVLGRADTLVWLDLPMWRIMLQLFWRTLTRVFGRKVLWNGNRETWSNLLSTDPHKSILAFALEHEPILRARYEALVEMPGHLRIVRLTSQEEVRAFAHQVAAAGKL